MLEPFTEGYLVHEVPVYDRTTSLYTRFGDWLARGSLYLCLLIFAGAGIVAVIRHRRLKDN